MTENAAPPPLSPDDLVVIADDEAFSRLMLAEVLDRLGAPRVITARNGREVLTVLDDSKATGVRVVILDFNMPEANGIEVLQEIRSGRRAVPHDVIVMMITNISALGLMAAAVALDVDVFLSKPIGLAALHADLVNVLESARDCATPDFYAGLDVAWLTTLKQIDTSSQQGEYVSLYALSEGMVLANNLFDEQGDLLVAAGSRVTPRLLRLLNGLAACGLPLDRLRVTRSA